MARIVCQVLFRADRVTFLWSDVSASFPPYVMRGEERDALLQAAAQIHDRLPQGDAGELARLGHALYRALFRLDAREPGSARNVHTWVNRLLRENAIDRLEFLSDLPGAIPWGLLCDQTPNPGDGWSRFWGSRFILGTGRRVHPWRLSPALRCTSQRFLVDPSLVQEVADQSRVSELKELGRLLYTVGTIRDEIKKSGPDLIALLVKVSAGRLYIGPDELDLDELQQWLDTVSEGNPDPLILLMGVGARDEQRAWLNQLACASAAFSGLIANETLLPAADVFKIGQALVQRIADGRGNVGTVLRDLRQEHGAAAFAFSGYMPTQVCVCADPATEAPEPDAKIELLPLPAEPYRPFAAFEAADRPLLVGRELDILRGAAALDGAAMRGLVLLGTPSVGKTSFLQAGLLPFLEQESIGYRVLRDRTPGETPSEENQYPVLILRATSDLAGQFADALAVFCAQPFHYTSPDGERITVDLPNILRQCVTGAIGSSTAIQDPELTSGITEGAGDDAKASTLSARELWIGLRDSKELLGQILDAICSGLPFELVLPIDQGDDLVALVRTPQQRVRRHKALDMLQHLSRAAPRCKFVLVMRTQTVGALAGLMRGGQLPADWRPYCLQPLGPEALTAALLAPTERKPAPYSDEVPHAKYGFSYEKGLARAIVTGIETGAEFAREPLPLVHVFGALLYEWQVVGKQQDLLRLEDVRQFDKVKPLEKALEQRLQRLPIANVTQRALRDLIAILAISNPDGSIGRDLVSAAELKEAWPARAEPVEQVVNQAATEQGLFEIQQLMIGGQVGVYVSLPQDSLAQLGKWIERERTQQQVARTKVVDMLWIMIPLIFLAAAISFWATRQFGPASGLDEETRTAIREKFDEIKKEGDKKEQAVRENARRPLYYGQLARAQQALLADNALRAQQILTEQPAFRSFNEGERGNKLADLRGFEWRHLWKHLNGERYRLFGHLSHITSAAIAPGSKLAATGSIDGTVRVWNLQTGELIASLTGARTPVHAVAFAPDGKTIASAGADRLVHLWDLGDAKADTFEIKTPRKSLQGHTAAVNAVAFGKVAGSLASGGADKSVIVWDVGAGKEKHVLNNDHTAAVHALAFSPDGTTLISAGAEADVLLWDPNAGKKLKSLKTPLRSVASISVASSGGILCTGGTETRGDLEVGVLHFWSIDTLKETLPAIEHGSAVLAVSFGPGGKTVASGGGDRIVRLWDVASGTQVQRWIGHIGAIGAMAYADDGSVLVSGSHDATARAWNPEHSSGSETVAAHTDWVSCLALDRKNALLASGSRDGTLKLWDAATGRLLKDLPAQKAAISALEFSSHKDKTYLAVGTRSEKDEGAIKILQIEHDSKTGYSIKEKQVLTEHKSGVTCLAFHPAPAKADVLISGSSDNLVRAWNIDSGKATETYRGHKDSVRALAFSRDSKLFASGGKDGLVCLHEVGRADVWTITDLHLASIESIAFLPAPRGHEEESTAALTLLTGSADQTVRIWDLARNEQGQIDAKNLRRSFRTHAQTISKVAAISDRDSELLVSASLDGTLKLYDVFHERLTLAGHKGAVRTFAVASDLSFIATAGNDGTIRFWRAARGPGME